MSIDPFHPSGGPFPTPPATGTIKDIIIIYGGWGGPRGGGTPLTPGTSSGTAQLLQDVQRLSPVPLHENRILGLEGSLNSAGGVNQGLTFIRGNFDPRGRLIIYGYSAGGTDALSLCRLLGSEGFYDMNAGDVVGVFEMERRMNSHAFANVTVDLLITVDAASGPGSGAVDRSVGSHVRRNLNFFQRKRSPILSRGDANVALDTNGTRVENNDLSAEGAEHSTIDEMTNARALNAIRGALGIVVPDPVTPPGTLPA